MSEVPFRTTVEGGTIDVPDHIWDALELEDGDVVTAGIMLDSGSVPPAEDLDGLATEER